jgi:hypothetical protein
MEADYAAPVARPDRLTFDTVAERAINHFASRPSARSGARPLTVTNQFAASIFRLSSARAPGPT